ncbi:MAG: hypothetical protein H7Z72_01810 [Bacteroidetes bacterium]|nr:hypothetical protein [Fibrella sp.]
MNFITPFIALSAVSIGTVVGQVPRQVIQTDDRATLQQVPLQGPELTAVQNVMTDFNRKVDVQLRKQPEYSRMTADLERLKTLKDPAQRRTAVARYQATYRPVLDKSLLAAKVSKAELKAQLERTAPDQAFTFSSDYGLKAIARTTSKPQKLVKRQSTAAPGPTVQIIRLDDFTESHDKSGALASSGDYDFSSTSVKSSSGAAIAGGCSVDARLRKSYTVPADVRKATLKLNCKLETDAYTVSVVGPSLALAGSQFGVSTNQRNLNADSAYSSVLGVIGWVMFEESGEEIDEEIDLPIGEKVDIYFSTYTTSMAGLSGYSDGHGRVKSIRVEIHLQR